MAKIQKQTLVITFSRLVRDAEDDSHDQIGEDMISTIEQVVQELSPPGIMVEVESHQ